jgi:preprotein translocase subunit Sec63
MAGQKFEYDEKGSTFLYFLLSFLGLCLIPATYYGWPGSEKGKKLKIRFIHFRLKCYFYILSESFYSGRNINQIVQM